MKEWETLKTYGKMLNKWTHTVMVEALRPYEEERTVQMEMAYREYDADGTLIHTGSEDFSISRWNANVKTYRVFTWDGKKHNKGGYRWFEEAMTVRIDRRDRRKLVEIAAKWFPNAAAVSVR